MSIAVRSRPSRTRRKLRDDPEAAAHKWRREFQPLVVTAARAVNDQNRRALSSLRVFDRPARRRYDCAAARDALPRFGHIGAISNIRQHQKTPDEDDCGDERRAFQVL